MMAVLEHDIDLNRRVAATVEDFPAEDGRDGGHGASFGLIAVRARDTLGPARVSIGFKGQCKAFCLKERRRWLTCKPIAAAAIAAGFATRSRPHSAPLCPATARSARSGGIC